jgi:penicillin-binding protein-related factor A (putative recombinase)
MGITTGNRKTTQFYPADETGCQNGFNEGGSVSDIKSANRGKSLEHALNKYITYLESIGVHAHKNHANRSHDGQYLAGEPFDYEIFRDKTLIAFDAKECKSNSFQTANCKLSQIKSLQDIERHGGTVFFLVYFFSSNSLVKYTLEQVMKNKSLKPDQGEGVKIYDL